MSEDAGRARVLQLLRAKAIAASARAKRVLLAAATGAVDAGIALLQRLRNSVGEAEDPDERRHRGRQQARNRATAGRGGSQAAAEEAAAPKPRRRLRALLVYLCVMLAGGMIGMALAYDLFESSLDRQSAQIKRQQVKTAKYSKSVAGLKRKLERQQAKKIEAETRLAAALAENEKKLGELRSKRADAEMRLARTLAARAGVPQRQETTGGSLGAARASHAQDRENNGGSRSDARNGKAGGTGPGECTLGSGNVRSALLGCVAQMNSR